MIRYIFLTFFFLFQSIKFFPQEPHWKNLENLYGGMLYSVTTYENLVYCAGNGGVFGSSNYGESWECIGLRDETVNEIKITSNYIFAASNRGFFRCRLHDSSWTKLQEGSWQAIGATDSVIFIGSDFAEFYKSTNLGDTWIEADRSHQIYGIRKIFICSNKIMLVSTISGELGSGVFRSTDMGDSWNRINREEYAWNFEGISEYGGVLYAFDFENYAKVYKSTDFGQTWHLPFNAAAPSDQIRSVYADQSGLYAGTYLYGFFHSNNEGITWGAYNTGLKNKTILALSGTIPEIFAATFDGIYKYTKGANSFTKKSTGINNCWITSLAEFNNNLLAGTYGSGLFIGDNQNFKSLNLGTDFMFISDILVSGNQIYVIAGKDWGDYESKLSVSYNGGSSWSQLTNNRDLPGIRYISKNDNYLYCGGSFNIYRKPVNSSEWEKLTNGLGDYIYVAGIACSDSVVILTNGSFIYRSSDFGSTWRSSNIQSFYPKKVISSKKGEFYIGSESIDKLYKSTDYGLTWQPLNTPVLGSDVQAIYTKDDEVFAGLSYNGILISEDEGRSWEISNDGLQSQNVTSFANIGNDIFAGTKLNGIYKRTSEAEIPDSFSDIIQTLSDTVFQINIITFEWSSSKRSNEYRFQLAEDSLFSKIIVDKPNISETHFTVSQLEYNRIYYWRVSSITMLWDDQFTKAQKVRITNPPRFVLYNNFPNPFNISTNIRFDVFVKGKIELELFNILGQKIKTLLNEEKDPGAYKYTLETERLVSGIYIIRLKTGGFSDAIKITLMK